MYPPVGIGQMRVSYSHDITLGGKLSIPAGTVLWVPHHSIQNVSFNWDEPQKFTPGEPRVNCRFLHLCAPFPWVSMYMDHSCCNREYGCSVMYRTGSRLP